MSPIKPYHQYICRYRAKLPWCDHRHITITAAQEPLCKVGIVSFKPPGDPSTSKGIRSMRRSCEPHAKDLLSPSSGVYYVSRQKHDFEDIIGACVGLCVTASRQLRATVLAYGSLRITTQREAEMRLRGLTPAGWGVPMMPPGEVRRHLYIAADPPNQSIIYHIKLIKGPLVFESSLYALFHGVFLLLSMRRTARRL